MRDIDSERSRELEGSEGALDKGLFWSPDSRFVGFATAYELRKTPLQGGPAIMLCRLPGSFLGGGAWSFDGSSIVFASPRPGTNEPVLYEVPVRGGDPTLLFQPEPTKRNIGWTTSQPIFLPSETGARIIAYNVGNAYDRDIVVRNLETGDLQELGEGAFPAYSPTGHIVYQTAAFSPGIWARPFSPETLQPTGPAFPIARNGSDPSVAMDGTLVFADGPLASQRIEVRDRTGAIVRAVGDAVSWAREPAISPNARFVAAWVEGDIWLFDLERDLRTRLTSTVETESAPAWLPSGDKLSYFTQTSTTDTLMIQAADGSGKPRLVVEDSQVGNPRWSPDGRYVVYDRQSSDGSAGHDISYRKLTPEGTMADATPFLVTSSDEMDARFSPDGRFLAYISNESGRYEVYVRPFPPAPGKWQISTGGGLEPVWLPGGEELYYVAGSSLMTVAISTQAAFTAEQPRPLFELESLRAALPNWHMYDALPGGQEFVTFGPSGDGNASPTVIRVVENWYEEFRNREKD